MHQEKYNLIWHNFSDHLKSMMKESMMNEDFSDVTLVTEDKKQIKANINILSACSPVFKDILKKDKNSRTIMYLRGVQYSELELIIQFIYLGEATLNDERMDDFLSVAKSLEIKELCNDEIQSNCKLDDYLPPNEQDTSTEFAVEQTVISDSTNKQAPQQRQEFGKYECDKCQKTYSSNSGLYIHKQAGCVTISTISNLSAVSDTQMSDQTVRTVHQGGRYACNQCDYQAKYKGSLVFHIQSKHEGVKYACNQCDYQAKQKGNLVVHIQSKHEGVRYACDQCNYKATKQDHLTKHIQSKHKGVKYACAQCDYQYSTQSNLNIHIQNIHEGVKHACAQCDNQFATQRGLKVHIQSKHEGVKYVCDQCDFQAFRKDYLTKHIQSIHEGVKFDCAQCDYQFKSKSNLNQHFQSKHGGVNLK